MLANEKKKPQSNYLLREKKSTPPQTAEIK